MQPPTPNVAGIHIQLQPICWHLKLCISISHKFPWKKSTGFIEHVWWSTGEKLPIVSKRKRPPQNRHKWRLLCAFSWRWAHYLKYTCPSERQDTMKKGEFKRKARRGKRESKEVITRLEGRKMESWLGCQDKWIIVKRERRILDVFFNLQVSLPSHIRLAGAFDSHFRSFVKSL